MAPDEKTAGEIGARMEAIRGRSVERKKKIAESTHRMLDWREHLRAAPTSTFIAGTLAGFALLYRRPAKSVAVFPMPATSSSKATTESPSAKSSLTSAVISMATTFLLTSGKQYLLRSLQSYLQNRSYEREPNRSDPKVNGQKEWVR